MAMYPCLSLPSLSFPSVSGAVCSFDSQYAGLPLKSHSVAVVGMQSGSGTPSPSNPRALNGWSAINISHSDADTSNPTVYTIQIGSTVYGGNYDAVSGVLTAKLAIATFDGSNDENWLIGNYGWNVYINIPDAKGNQAVSTGSTAISNLFPLCSQDQSEQDKFFISGGKNLNIGYLDDVGGTIADWRTFLSNNNLQVAYELATPQTIQLPPCPIDTLEGVNNIWADTGDTTLQYIKLG